MRKCVCIGILLHSAIECFDMLMINEFVDFPMLILRAFFVVVAVVPIANSFFIIVNSFSVLFVILFAILFILHIVHPLTIAEIQQTLICPSSLILRNIV